MQFSSWVSMLDLHTDGHTTKDYYCEDKNYFLFATVTVTEFYQCNSSSCGGGGDTFQKKITKYKFFLH
jgi:hypothetical protein